MGAQIQNERGGCNAHVGLGLKKAHMQVWQVMDFSRISKEVLALMVFWSVHEGVRIGVGAELANPDISIEPRLLRGGVCLMVLRPLSFKYGPVRKSAVVYCPFNENLGN